MAPAGERLGLRPGDSMDLTTTDAEGKAWDFSNEAQRRRALQRIRDTEPSLVVGSPMCAMFSPLQALSCKKTDPMRFRKAYQEAVSHLKFCLEVYRLQVAGAIFS